MYESQTPRAEGRAVSPVIGVILMVAITVILAAVIGTFVLGLSPDHEPSTTVTIGIDGDVGENNITLTHNGGESIELDDITVLVNGDSGDGNSSLSGTFEPGERVLVTKVASGDEQTVTIRHDKSGEILSQDTVHID